MQITQITPANVHDFPVGSVVLSRYGAMYPEVEGVVIGHKILPATKFFEASAALIVRQDNFLNEADESEVMEITVSQLYETNRTGPIGTYLISLAEKPIVQNVGPWGQ